MLELRDITKQYDGKPVLAGISLQVPQGEVLALLGPSGSGKSTLLAIVAGLEPPDSGQVLWNGQDVTAVPPHQRGFGLMFQDYALFPHRDVFGNVAFGLQMAGQSTAATAASVQAALALVGLQGFEHRDVNSLSGGEQQRVALARALAPEPQLLMLDEPLGSLDRALRTHLVSQLASILRQQQLTSLYVTHDQEEAYAIADRVAILNAGQLAQIGTPEQLYRKPATVFVARFLGMQNIFPTQLEAGKLMTPLGELPAPPALPGGAHVLLRPDAVRIGAQGPRVLSGVLLSKQFRGSRWQLELGVQDTQIQIELPSDVALPALGATLQLSFDPAQAIQILSNE
ncbi:MAG TPA: ABC transporter ATP-binding protein [Anaerolineales bacterium]|nr:ABC transporter ATP-binding protein [Anaerolineales bacterium]HRQ92434.1 ABC transporter ATP-binding protein [Anaerolineales bacterium]